MLPRRLVKSLLQIPDNILRVLNPDRQPQKLICDPQFVPLLLRNIRMGLREGIRQRAFRPSRTFLSYGVMKGLSTIRSILIAIGMKKPGTCSMLPGNRL